MTDDLIDLPDEALERPSIKAAVDALVPHADTINAALREIDILNVELATPEERGELVRFRNVLYLLSVGVRTHLATIDHLFRRAYVRTDRTAFMVGPRKQDVVTIEKPRGQWLVKDAELREGLQALAAKGIIPVEDVDRAVAVEIQYHVDNRVVKGLEKYGPEVKDLIERTRRYQPGNPESAPVKYPKP